MCSRPMPLACCGQSKKQRFFPGTSAIQPLPFAGCAAASPGVTARPAPSAATAAATLAMNPRRGERPIVSMASP